MAISCVKPLIPSSDKTTNAAVAYGLSNTPLEFFSWTFLAIKMVVNNLFACHFNSISDDFLFPSFLSFKYPFIFYFFIFNILFIVYVI